jgi:hypothetical protein
VQVVRCVVIDCHVEDVFDYLADPLHDRDWLTCVEPEAPRRVIWRWEADGDGVEVSFALDPVWTSTRVTARREHRGRGRARAARDLDRRLEALRQRLERR